MQFSLDEYTTATLLHVNKRTETHGADKKHALDLKWGIDGPNTILAKFPGLLDAMYEPNATEDIPGVVATRPNLRTGHWLKGPHKIVYEASSNMLTIKDGPVSGAKLELPSSDVNKFEWEPKGGNGHGRLTFNTQHVGMDQQTMGRILIMDGRQVDLLVAPLSLQDGTVPEAKLTKLQQKAKAKADAQKAFSQPFKFGAGENGETIDRTPLPDKDKDAPDAGTIFAEKEAAGETTPAKPAAKKTSKVISLKPGGRAKARTGKGS
jgi:hypothetical protein